MMAILSITVQSQQVFSWIMLLPSVQHCIICWIQLSAIYWKKFSHPSYMSYDRRTIRIISGQYNYNIEYNQIQYSAMFEAMCGHMVDWSQLTGPVSLTQKSPNTHRI